MDLRGANPALLPTKNAQKNLGLPKVNFNEQWTRLYGNSDRAMFPSCLWVVITSMGFTPKYLSLST
jgi:hypothetical protein